MVREIIIRPGDPEGRLAHLQNLLLRPMPILQGAALILQRASHRAFEDQSFDGTPWPRRYAWQPDPFVNKAALVRGFANGEQFKSQWLDRRPALRLSSRLFNSIIGEAAITEVGSHSISLGSNVEYAGLQHFGGESTQPVTEDVKDAVGKFLSTPQGFPYTARLIDLLEPDVEELTTKVMPRPFIGVTEEAALRIRDMTEALLVPEGSGALEPTGPDAGGLGPLEPMEYDDDYQDRVQY